MSKEMEGEAVSQHDRPITEEKPASGRMLLESLTQTHLELFTQIAQLYDSEPYFGEINHEGRKAVYYFGPFSLTAVLRGDASVRLKLGYRRYSDDPVRLISYEILDTFLVVIKRLAEGENPEATLFPTQRYPMQEEKPNDFHEDDFPFR